MISVTCQGAQDRNEKNEQPNCEIRPRIIFCLFCYRRACEVVNCLSETSERVHALAQDIDGTEYPTDVIGLGGSRDIIVQVHSSSGFGDATIT
jgi:hypothetical protein